MITTLTTAATKPTGNLNLTATLSGSSTAFTTLYIDPIAALSGATSFLTFPTAGTYTVTVTYPGNGNVSGSTAKPLVVVVAPPPPTNFTLTLDNPDANTEGER